MIRTLATGLFDSGRGCHVMLVVLAPVVLAPVVLALGVPTLVAPAPVLLRLGATPALARDDGQWGSQPPEIRAWFQALMQPGLPFLSCCGEGDAFAVKLGGEAPNGDLRAVILDGRGQMPNGSVVMVPRDKLQTKYGNPLDKVILFLTTSGKPLCLIPKVGV